MKNLHKKIQKLIQATQKRKENMNFNHIMMRFLNKLKGNVLQLPQLAAILH